MSEKEFRKWHELRGLTSDRVPGNYLFVDCETLPSKHPDFPDREIHELRLWCAISARFEGGKWLRVKEHTGTSPESFWELVETKSHPRMSLWLFAHNLGFDLTVLHFWQWLLHDQFQFRQTLAEVDPTTSKLVQKEWNGIACLEDLPTILKFRIHETMNEIVAVDTLNYWRCPLADLGEDVGIPKLKMPDFEAPDETWRHYCMNDCKVIYEAVKSLVDLIRTEHLGKLAYTAAGQSMNSFRRQCLPMKPPLIIHGNSDAIKMERLGYFGGATHLFYQGRVVKPEDYWSPQEAERKHDPVRVGPVYVLDVQSFYPSVMREYSYPNSLRGTWDDIGPQAICGLLEKYCVMATVAIQCKAPGYPVRRKGESYYAQGKFVTTLCGEELLNACQKGHVRYVIGAQVYHRAPIFREWVERLWNLRLAYKLQGNFAWEGCIKLILNGLYGKFGQRTNKWIDVPEQPSPFPFGYWWLSENLSSVRRQCRSIGYLTQMRAERDEHWNSFPAISAHVTSYGRSRMELLFDVAGRGNVLYSDTDSLHVLEPGYQRIKAEGLIAENELGLLRLVAVADEAEYRARKNYTLDQKDVVAGVPRSAEKIGHDSYRFRKFERLGSVIAKPGIWTIEVREDTYHFKQTCRVGSVSRDGTVSPVTLSEF